MKFKTHWDWGAKIEMIEKHQEKKVKKYFEPKTLISLDSDPYLALHLVSVV